MCAGNPRRVSCAIEILSFQNFYRVLKTDSAGRKDFFDALSQGGVSIDTPPCFFMPCLRETVIHYINNMCMVRRYSIARASDRGRITGAGRAYAVHGNMQKRDRRSPKLPIF